VRVRQAACIIMEDGMVKKQRQKTYRRLLSGMRRQNRAASMAAAAAAYRAPHISVPHHGSTITAAASGRRAGIACFIFLDISRHKAVGGWRRQWRLASGYRWLGGWLGNELGQRRQYHQLGMALLLRAGLVLNATLARGIATYCIQRAHAAEKSTARYRTPPWRRCLLLGFYSLLRFVYCAERWPGRDDM